MGTLEYASGQRVRVEKGVGWVRVVVAMRGLALNGRPTWLGAVVDALGLLVVPVVWVLGDLWRRVCGKEKPPRAVVEVRGDLLKVETRDGLGSVGRSVYRKEEGVVVKRNGTGPGIWVEVGGKLAISILEELKAEELEEVVSGVRAGMREMGW